VTADEHTPGTELVPLETSYEVELDAPPAGPPVPVDAPPTPAGTRLPVIPAHLRTMAGVRAATARQAGGLAHRSAYHAVRAPRYLLLAAMWSVVGVLRVAARQVRWWWLAEQWSLRSQAAASGDSREWMRLHKEAKETRQARGFVLLGELLALLVAAWALARYAPAWVWAVVALVLLVALARAGRPADRRIISPATVTPRFRKLTADIVLRAYYAAGLGNPDKPGQQVTFGSTMARDGEGSRVLVDLPYGLGLKDAIEARPKIASGLDVTESQVFIKRDPTSYRRHVLWVADRDPLAVPVGRTPLLAGRPADIWRPAERPARPGR
jgi:DNA segregation ATPase FtsK/SpoIIIE, S-DNA-T family